MTEQRAQRQLSAILAADVAGYSRLIGLDEEGTLNRLKMLRRIIIDPKISEHRGRIVKTMGDGLLVQFASAVDAVRCAVEIQRLMTEQNLGTDEDRRIEFRIGINVGDVVVDGDDIHGDGVNVAARLEGFSDAGGVCVSQTVYDHVQDKLDLTFKDAGEQRLKNIARLVRVYQVLTIPSSTATAVANRDRPSIAVLPFTNMSSDPEQDYFVDGLAEDLITDLSKVPGFLVIARHSSFAFKGRSIDIRLIAKELGVRYLIEGSVRRSTNRIRINAQLINAEDNTHIWADRFDRDLEDVFLLQDEIVSRIVSALAGALPKSSHSGKTRTTNLEAYDLFAQGRLLVTQSTEANIAARPLLEKAIALDPKFAEAHAWLAFSHFFGWAYAGEPQEEHRSFALSAAKQAVALDSENADAHAVLGNLLILEDDLVAAAAELATSLRINPNYANSWMFLAEMKVKEGRAIEAIELAQKGFRLNPYPPGWYYWILGYAQYAAHQYEQAVETLRHKSTHLSASTRVLAAALAQLGRLEEAREEARQFLALNPHFSINKWASIVAFRNSADLEHFTDGYLKAGLPM